ncbi:TPA: hypothetical protein ACOEHQ_000355 [Enterobacter ludwigii]
MSEFIFIINHCYTYFRQTDAGEANENITVGYFNYISDRAAGGDRCIQDDFLISLPGSAPGTFRYLD